MDCPTEEALIRKRLGAMPEVQALDFNLMRRELTVAHAPEALAGIEAAIRKLGMTPEAVPQSGKPDAAVEGPKPLWPLAVAGLAAVAAEAAQWLGLPQWLAAALAIAAIDTCGPGTYRKGWMYPAGSICHERS